LCDVWICRCLFKEQQVAKDLTLATFGDLWREYAHHIRAAIAPLTAAVTIRARRTARDRLRGSMAYTAG